MQAAGLSGISSTASEPPPDAPVLVCLLGGMRLLKLGRAVPVRAGGKTEGLLLHLGIRQGRSLPRDVLLERVWPNSKAVLAAQALSSLMYSLHRVLGQAIGGAPPILRDLGGYRLNREAGVGVDTNFFDALATAGDRNEAAGDLMRATTAYDQAAHLYHGDLVAGGDPYAVVERERLRARYLRVLARLADYHFDRREYGACLDVALTLLKTDPGREDAHRLVMRCYVRRGERTQALRQYQLCVQLLRAEFDATPELTTVALFDGIRLDPASV